MLKSRPKDKFKLIIQLLRFPVMHKVLRFVIKSATPTKLQLLLNNFNDFTFLSPAWISPLLPEP